jgi:hypothetical protein
MADDPVRGGKVKRRTFVVFRQSHAQASKITHRGGTASPGGLPRTLGRSLPSGTVAHQTFRTRSLVAATCPAFRMANRYVRQSRQIPPDWNHPHGRLGR